MGVHFHFFEHFIQNFAEALFTAERWWISLDRWKEMLILGSPIGGGQGLQVGLRWHHGPQKSSGDCKREGHGAEEL